MGEMEKVGQDRNITPLSRVEVRPRSKVRSRIIRFDRRPRPCTDPSRSRRRARFSDICPFWSTDTPSSRRGVSQSSSGLFGWGVNTPFRSPVCRPTIAADCPARCQVPFSEPSFFFFDVITLQDLSCVVPVVWACICVDEVGVILRVMGGDDTSSP